jgi:hypothetical protein
MSKVISSTLKNCRKFSLILIELILCAFQSSMGLPLCFFVQMAKSPYSNKEQSQETKLKAAGFGNPVTESRNMPLFSNGVHRGCPSALDEHSRS